MIVVALLALASVLAPSAVAAAGWMIQPTPNPSMAASAGLGDVWCTAKVCVAVGSYRKTSGDTLTLAERWNGKHWTIQKTPRPKGATSAALNGVSCTAKTCIAVGFHRKSPTSGKALPLAEYWNGKHWTIQKTPNPKGATSAALNGVSCTPKACVAVGSSNTSVGVTLIERWNGKKWTIQKTPNPKAATLAGLGSVSCTAANACTAVGFYSAAGRIPLAERWNGKKWTIQSTPSPPVSAGLRGVSCTATNACTAVGSQSTTGGLTGRTLAEHWNGKKWTIQSTPSPPVSAGLGGVSCTATETCTAVGSYTKTLGGGGTTLAERNT